MKKLAVTVAARVMLAVIFALLIAALKWEYFRWGVFSIRFVNTFFYPASIVFVAALLLSALLHPVRELYRNGRIPFIQGSVENFISNLRLLFSRLNFQFLFWGVIMILLVVFAWNLDLLRDEEYRFNQMPLPWRGIEKSTGESPVVLFNYYSRDNNQRNYLQNCAKIARDLKQVGAKAVLIPLPNIFSEESKKLVQEIHKSGIVVFGVRNESDYHLAQAREESGIHTGRLSLDIYKRHPFHLSFIHKVNPFPAGNYQLWKNAHDVTFEILRLYYGLPRNLPVSLDGDNLVFGKLRASLDEKGMLNVGSLSWPNYHINLNAGYDMDFVGKGRSEKPKFEYTSVGRGKIERISNLEPYKQRFEGKIVILQWHDLGGLSMPFSYRESQDYAQVIDNILRGKVLKQTNLGSLLIGLISILGCGLILYRSRLIAAVGLLILFSFMILYGSAWLFQEKGLLVDIPVAIASVVASIAVFSVLRLGNEWRFGIGRSTAISPAPETRKSSLDPGTSSGSLGFLQRRFAFSLAAAVGVLLLAVVLTALVTRSISDSQPAEPQKVVYVTSLPTVEVQGMYIPNKEVKQ